MMVAGGSMPGRRPERIAEQIREEVSQLITGEMRDPRIGPVTVTEVKVTPDLRHAKVFVGIIGSEEQARDSLSALRSASKFIRHHLGSALRLKYTPEVHFVFDNTLDSAMRIEEVLKEEMEKLKEREASQMFSDSNSTP
jgi:ribosome-binding factor A